MRWLALLLIFTAAANAQSFAPVPYTFVNGTKYNPSQVMADFQSITNSGNSVSAAINSAILSHTPEPSGIRLWFNLSSCPGGWTASSFGTLFVRGYDAGRGLDPTATGIGGTETDAMQSHTHSTGGIIIGGLTTGIATFVGGTGKSYWTGMSSTSNPSSGGPTGTLASEVRPNNVSLLLCRKN